jgi:molybdopterin converting factor small subunit
MASVVFTPALRRFLRVPDTEVAGATVGEALAGAFGANHALRSYVLDDQGALRRHVAIYVNGEPVRDRTGLGDPVADGDEIYVFQALTGG